MSYESQRGSGDYLSAGRIWSNLDEKGVVWKQPHGLALLKNEATVGHTPTKETCFPHNTSDGSWLIIIEEFSEVHIQCGL